MKVLGNRVKLPKIGTVLFFNSRPCEGNIKQAVVSKTVSGWYISITCEVEQKPLPVTDQRIGIDVGISHLAITSEGELIENPKHTKKYERQLRVAQRSLARKVKGSNNRAKQKRVVARLHEKIRNTRKDYHHKVSSRLVSENQAIACEALVVSNMVRNRSLSKAISDAGWSQFTTYWSTSASGTGVNLSRLPRPTRAGIVVVAATVLIRCRSILGFGTCPSCRC